MAARGAALTADTEWRGLAHPLAGQESNRGGALVARGRRSLLRATNHARRRSFRKIRVGRSHRTDSNVFPRLRASFHAGVRSDQRRRGTAQHGHTQRYTIERELENEEFSPELEQALAAAEAADDEAGAAPQPASALSAQIWADYEECAVLVKSLRSMGSSEMLTGRAADVLHALRRQLDTGLAELHGVEERLEAEVAETRGRQAAATPTPGAVRVEQRVVRTAPPGQQRSGRSSTEPEPEPEPELQPPPGVASHRQQRGSSAGSRRSPTGGVAGDGLDSLRTHDEQLQRQLSQLDSRFNYELQKIADQFAANLPPEVSESEHGGWEPREHAVFHKLAREFGRSGKRETPAGRKKYLERLQLELPHIHPDEILYHDDWYDKRRYTAKKRAALVRQWKNARSAALTEAQYALEQAAEEAVAALEFALDRRAVEAKKAALHRRLQVGEAVKGHRDEVKAKLEAEALAVEEAEQAKAMAERKLMMEEGKRKVEEWREARAVEAAQALRAEEEAAELELEAYRAMLEHAAERVEVRQQIDQEKRDAAKDLRLLSDADAAARQEVLDSLAASVAPIAEYDPQRALGHTAVTQPMSKADRRAERDMRSQAGKHSTQGGYTSKQVMSDKRYRTMEALRGAGLHDTAHARAAIAAMPPTRVITQHLTTNQLAAMRTG